MNKEQFIKYYVPLIGTEVIDDNFNCPLTSDSKKNGLTKVRLQTEIVKRFYVEPFKQAVIKNNKKALLSLVDEMLNNAVLFGFKIAKKWLNTDVLPYSIGNSKIGNDTLVFNCSSALLCPSALKGHCEVCKSCYAVNNEVVYGMPFIRNLLSLKRLLTVNIDDLINNTIKLIATDNVKKDGKKAKEALFIRFNSNGDVLDDKMLLDINKFSKSLINDDSNKLAIAYSYTHNKDLNINLATDITFNISYKTDKAVKKTIVAFKWDKTYLDSSKYVICNGKCFNCPYCKNKDDKRTVVFMAHGGGLKGLDMLPDGLINVLNQQKSFDWAKFNAKLINPSNKSLSDFL
mgnify:CR=1 FL=1